MKKKLEKKIMQNYLQLLDIKLDELELRENAESYLLIEDLENIKNNLIINDFSFIFDAITNAINCQKFIRNVQD
jgi:hypothetical protein